MSVECKEELELRLLGMAERHSALNLSATLVRERGADLETQTMRRVRTLDKMKRRDILPPARLGRILMHRFWPVCVFSDVDFERNMYAVMCSHRCVRTGVQISRSRGASSGRCFGEA